MSVMGNRRLAKELIGLQKETPAGCRILKAEDLLVWEFEMLGGEGTLYDGMKFGLRFRFPKAYPIDFPEVTFLNCDGYKPPIHPHIYTNGHICASILSHDSNGWSPVLNVSAVILTMQSMLASNTKLESPRGNDSYVRSAPSNSKDTKWAFHDDTV